MLPLLITGPDPTELVQHALNHWQANSSLPEGTLHQSVTHPDIHLLPEDPQSTSIGIDQIRQLVKVLQLKPFQADSKLAIIHQAHLLTIEAQNALLKTLEEPPEQVQIVLTTTQPYALLPTILSRVIQKAVTGQATYNQLPATSYQPILSNVEGLLATTPSLRLIQTQAIAPTREAARDFVLQLLHYYHYLLVTKDQPLTTSYQPVLSNVEGLLATIKLLQRSLVYLDANTHPQLTIDYLLLHLPSIARVTSGNQLPKSV